MSDISFDWRDIVVRPNTAVSLAKIRDNAMAFWRGAKGSFARPAVPKFELVLDHNPLNIIEVDSFMNPSSLTHAPLQSISDLSPVDIQLSSRTTFKDIAAPEPIASEPQIVGIETRFRPRRFSFMPCLVFASG